MTDELKQVLEQIEGKLLDLMASVESIQAEEAAEIYDLELWEAVED